jgi:putative peptide zinc metalloprotease protein
MELFSFDVQARHFAVVLDLDLQLERLVVDNSVMSVKPLGKERSVHAYEDDQLGQLQLQFTLDPQAQTVNYVVQLSNAETITGVAELSEQAKVMLSTAPAPVASGNKMNGFVLLSIGAKLLKSFKVIKLALAAASVAVYSVMFTFEFALALVAVLVFHEYGHVRAMKKFGIPTKGFYLIPFMGGVAVGDKARTQWEELYISMMGPVFGLAMTAVFYVIFLVTGSHFCGLITATSALLNLVNLFPVYPLDGGHVVKAMVLSRRNHLALILLFTVSAICLYVAWVFGFYFLMFFIVIGVIDLIGAWSVPVAEDITPLSAYGIWFSLAWYLGVALAFIAMIVLLVEAKVPGAEIATKILGA